VGTLEWGRGDEGLPLPRRTAGLGDGRRWGGGTRPEAALGGAEDGCGVGTLTRFMDLKRAMARGRSARGGDATTRGHDVMVRGRAAR
jgi:hypothetical protein